MINRRQILTLFGMAPALNVPLKKAPDTLKAQVEASRKRLLDVWTTAPPRPRYPDYSAFSARIPFQPIKGGSFAAIPEIAKGMATAMHKRYLEQFDSALRRAQGNA